MIPAPGQNAAAERLSYSFILIADMISGSESGYLCRHHMDCAPFLRQNRTVEMNGSCRQLSMLHEGSIPLVVWSLRREQHLKTPDYVKILKLDKIAMNSKTRPDYISAAKPRLQYARNLGVEESFPFFVDRAWGIFGDGS